MYKADDVKFIKKCIELSYLAVNEGDAPFGALIVKDGSVIAEASNDARTKISDHAEIIAMHKAREVLGEDKLLECTLYSNCEPCPMCSFMAREYKVSRVVFSVSSPFMGGYSKWNILEDKGLENFPDFFGKIPEVVSGILETEAKKAFDNTPLWMFGTNQKEINR